MKMSNFNLRGLPPDVMISLKQKAHEQNLSVNMYILGLIEQDLGISRKAKRKIYHDLDHLAGKWTESDVKNFENNIKSYEKIDEELWL